MFSIVHSFGEFMFVLVSLQIIVCCFIYLKSELFLIDSGATKGNGGEV